MLWLTVLNLFILDTDKHVFGKQWRPRWNPASGTDICDFSFNFDLWSLKILIGQIHSYCINMYIMRKSIRIAAYGRSQDCFRRGSRKLCRGWEVQKDFVCFSHHIIQEGRRGGASQYSKHFIGVSLVGRDNVSFQWSWSGPPVSPSGSSN